MTPLDARTAADTGLDWSIIESALTLPERAALRRLDPALFTADPQRADMVRARWRDVLARGDDDTLDDRMGDLGFVDADLPFVVGTIDPAMADRLDAAVWMDVCVEVCRWDGARDEDGLPITTCLGVEGGDETGEPIPFEEALVPWVEVADRRLRARLSDPGATWGDRLLQRERRRLAENLATMARMAFMDDFDRRRMIRYDGNDIALGMLSGSPPRTVYAETVRASVGAQAEGWMRRWPALARLLGIRVVAWVRHVGEFLERLEEDRAAIGSTFHDGRDPGRLTTVSFGSGDSHNGGRSVGICTFESGLRLVYKPRNCRVDVAFRGIVDDLNRTLDPELHLRVPRTLDHDTYGWAEFIDSGPCEELKGVRRFHRRMGALLALIHTLQGNDFHLENVKASGEHPVPVDLETVCVPGLDLDESEEMIDETDAVVAKSVLRTLLLPSVMGLRGGERRRNLGAIRLAVGDGHRQVVRRLSRINTDFQRWVTMKGSEADGGLVDESRVTGAASLDADEQCRETTAGYVTTYEAILRRRDEWLAAGSPIHRLDDAWVRVLNRSTNVYVRLMQESCRPQSLVGGVERWLTVERGGLSIGRDPAREARATEVMITRAESDAMLDGDVAYFLARGGGRSYWIVEPESGRLRELNDTRLGTSAVDAALAQVEGMGPEDLALQTRLQDASYRTAIASIDRLFHPSVAVADAPAAPAAPVSAAVLRDAVHSTLDDLAAHAIASATGVNWIDFDMDVRLECVRPGALDAGLYNGRGGMAIVFEKAYRVLGDTRWLDLARRSLIRELQGWQRGGSWREWIVRERPTGMLVRGGLIAGLWAVGRHEGQGAFREAAREIAMTITDRTIRSDDDYDLIAGSAGHILLLLHLNEEEHIPGLPDLIARLADHLARNVVDVDGPGWRGSSHRLPLCGFAHGRAGIALALLEAGRLLDRSDLRDLALAVFDAEHRLRGKTPADGWPDFRGSDVRSRGSAPMGSVQWCSGTEGVALSRAAALMIDDAPVLRDDLAFAIESMRGIQKSGRGHLCCGRTGRTLAHQTLARLTSEISFDPGQAASIVATVLERGRRGEGGLMGVGLLQGSAGPVWAGLSLLDDDGSDLLLLRP